MPSLVAHRSPIITVLSKYAGLILSRSSSESTSSKGIRWGPLMRPSQVFSAYSTGPSPPCKIPSVVVWIWNRKHNQQSIKKTHSRSIMLSYCGRDQTHHLLQVSLVQLIEYKRTMKQAHALNCRDIQDQHSAKRMYV